jgi:hypothetical protein
VAQGEKGLIGLKDHFGGSVALVLNEEISWFVVIEWQQKKLMLT